MQKICTLFAAGILSVSCAAIFHFEALAQQQPEPHGTDEPHETDDNDETYEPEETEEPASEQGVESSVDSTGKVTVIGRPVDINRIAGSANSVTREQLEALEYDDITRVLQEVPGVYLRAEDGFGLRPNIGLRGANSDRSSKVTLMEDGVLLVPAPYSAPAAYYFPLTTRLVGVDIYKGPASIAYGPQTIGGAVNLRTREIPRVSSGELDLSYGLQRTGKVHGWWGISNEHWGVVIEAAHLQSDGFKELDGGGPTGFYRNDVMLKGHWNNDLNADVFHRIQIKLGYGDEESNETYLGLTRQDFERNPYRRYRASQRDIMDWWRTSAEIRYTVVPHDTFELELVAYRHDMNRVWNRLNSFRQGPSLDTVLKNPTAGQAAVLMAILRGEQDSTSLDQGLMVANNDRSYFSQGVQLLANWRPDMPWAWFTQEIELGVRLHHDGIDRHHRDQGFLMQSGAMVHDGQAPIEAARNQARTLAVATWLRDTIGLGDLLISPGLRVEIIQRSFDNDLNSENLDGSDVVLIPGVGLSYRLGDFTILGGVHKGFSPVAPGQANSVKPEESINYEAGVRYAPESAHIELIGFFNDYKNLTGECTFSSGCSEAQINDQFNGGRVWVYGLEAAGSWRGQIGGGVSLGLSASYTLTLSQFRTGFLSDFPQFGQVEEGHKLPYVPEHQAAALVGLAWQGLSLNTSFTYVGPMRDTAGDAPFADVPNTDSQYLLDTTAAWRTDSGFTFYARGENLLNQAYSAALRPFGERPNRPLLFQLGVKIPLGTPQT